MLGLWMIASIDEEGSEIRALEVKSLIGAHIVDTIERMLVETSTSATTITIVNTKSIDTVISFRCCCLIVFDIHTSLVLVIKGLPLK